MPSNTVPTRRVMTKRVNIDAPTAIRALNPPLLGKANNIIMSTGDILKCLCKRAKVYEVLPDGTTIRLNMANYYLDNSAQATRIPAPPVQEQPATIQSEMVVSEPEDVGEEETPVEEEPVGTDEPETEESSATEAEAAEEEGASESAAEAEQPAEEVAPPQIPVPQPPKQNKRGPKKHK